jgi:hypothetical protein
MNYANKIGWSDIDPYEIVKRVSEKCLEIREMDSERDPFWRPDAEVDGFLAHVKNNVDQRWICSSNPKAAVVRIRLHKDGRWRDKFGNRYRLANQPEKFYDYNF